MQQPRGLAVVTVDASSPSTRQGRALQCGEEPPWRLLEAMDADGPSPGVSAHGLLCGLASPWGLLACGVALLALGAEAVSVATRYWVSALWPLVGKTVDRARGS